MLNGKNNRIHYGWLVTIFTNKVGRKQATTISLNLWWKGKHEAETKESVGRRVSTREKRSALQRDSVDLGYAPLP
jgi:hypothetical protein